MSRKLRLLLIVLFPLIVISYHVGDGLLLGQSHQDVIRQTNKIEEAKRLIIAADKEFEKSRYKEAEAKYVESLKIYEEMKDKVGIADCSYKLGRVCNRLSKYDRAGELLERASRVHEEIADREGIGLDLTERGTTEIKRNKYKISLEISDRALKINEEVRNIKAIYETLRNICEAYRYLGKYDKALEYAEKSLRTAEQMGNKSGAALSLNNIGIAHWNLGNNSQALEYHQKALKLREEMGDKSAVAASLNNIGSVYFNLGNYTQALKYQQKALKIREEIGDRGGVASSLNNLGVLHTNLGNYTKAFEYHQKSLKTREEIGDKNGIARTLNNMGLVHESLSNYTEALEDFKKSLKISEEIEYRQGVSNTPHNIGMVHDILGNHSNALEYYQKSLQIHETMGNKSGVALSLLTIGVVHKSLGNYTQALDCFQKALKIGEQTGDKNKISASLNNIGSVHESLRNYTQALEYYQKTLKMKKEIGNRRRVAASLNNIGRVHEGLNHYAPALEYYQEAMKIAKEIGDKREVAGSLSYIGSVHYKRKEKLDADRNLSEAINISKQIGTPDTLWVSLHKKALVLRDTGEMDQAIALMKEAIQVIEQVRGQIQLAEQKASFFQNKLEVYEDLIQLLVKLQNTQEAFNYAERARARAFLDLLYEAKVNVNQGIDSALSNRKREIEARLSFLHRKIQQADSLPKRDDQQIGDWKSELNSKFDAYEQLQREIRRLNPKYADLHYPEPKKLEDVQRILDDKTAVLEYLLSEDASFLFVITRDHFQLYTLIKGKEIKDRVDGLRASIARGTTTRVDQLAYLDQARKLHQILIKPVESILQDKKELIVIPDRILYKLPFEVLLKPDVPSLSRAISDTDFSKLPYLIRDHAISYAQSATVLVNMKDKNHQATGQKALLAYGDPIYEGEKKNIDKTNRAHVRSAFPSASNLSRLEYSGKEVRQIADLYKDLGAKIHLRELATKRTLMQEELDDYKYIHFAVHASMNEDKPQLSFLALTREDNSDDDGLLKMMEVFNLKMKADLVFLSACQTGLGKEMKGEGIVGMTRAFMYAGAASVIVSLWNVYDPSTADLMVKVHKNLIKSTKAEALRQAKLELIKSAQYSHPYFWSPFVLIGNND